ncbi:MAG: ribosomal-processing cysteine protease Prp [Clostridia bacterium]|nr:ribosomal-processing cysteine protease Prp [Clostridia bacterium]
MIRAKYTVDENTHTLSVLGHANYAEYGKDIVCAGVSALVQALIGWIEENHYKADCISIDTKNGEVIISCEGGEDIAAVFNMASIGLLQIADSYPDHVQIDIIGIAG